MNKSITNNLKSYEKVFKRMISLSFIFIVMGGLLLTGLFAMRNKLIINEYENRTANRLEYPTIEKLLNGNFQNDIDIALADQLPKAITIKKIYNFYNALLTKKITNLLVGKHCDNNYISYNGILTYGCNDTLVYAPIYYENHEEQFNNRIDNINNLIKKSNAPIYIFYIEKDTDINFIDNKKTGIYYNLTTKINTNHMHAYEINNFNEFSKLFYKTDHHWNYIGSYRGYEELHDFLELKDSLLIPLGTVCSNEMWAGSKANISGSQKIYGEKLCAYSFDFPSYSVKINGYDVLNYGFEDINNLPAINYGTYYGYDYGEVIIDFNNHQRENILLIGESYDNAILKLIGSHYNKLYAIDLRHYTDENSKEFKLNEYIKVNDIDKVVLIGNYDYFVSEIFNVEV